MYPNSQIKTIVVFNIWKSMFHLIWIVLNCKCFKVDNQITDVIFCLGTVAY